MVEISNYFDLNEVAFSEIFFLEGLEYPWDILDKIKNFILDFPKKEFEKLEYRFVRGNIWVHKSTVLPADLEITGPVLIGRNCSIRSGARIRPNTIIGNNANIGNGVEIKNSFLSSNVNIPHSGVYVGNAIIGKNVYISVGAIFANRYDPLLNSGKILVHILDKYDNPMRKNISPEKFSALVGDGSHINPNAVINPGTMIEKNVSVAPLAFVKGLVPAYHIVKRDGKIVENRNPPIDLEN